MIHQIDLCIPRSCENVPIIQIQKPRHLGNSTCNIIQPKREQWIPKGDCFCKIGQESAVEVHRISATGQQQTAQWNMRRTALITIRGIKFHSRVITHNIIEYHHHCHSSSHAKTDQPKHRKTWFSDVQCHSPLHQKSHPLQKPLWTRSVLLSWDCGSDGGLFTIL